MNERDIVKDISGFGLIILSSIPFVLSKIQPQNSFPSIYFGIVGVLMAIFGIILMFNGSDKNE